MNRIILLLGLIALASAGEKLIFDEDFKTFDLSVWEHELTLSGGGNWEFEWYVNNRSNSYVRDGILYIKPTFTEDAIGHDKMWSGDMNIWGDAPADLCTSNAFWGCERNAAASGNVINPVRSAKIRTVNSFWYRYGRIEIKAKLPNGDWLWPALWTLPKRQEYGPWPASGEVDLVESRGNDPSYPLGGSNTYTTTLHWGVGWDQNKWEMTYKKYTHSESLAKDFHLFGMVWTESEIHYYLDD